MINRFVNEAIFVKEEDMEKKKVTLGSVLTVAGTYLAFAIGSGFATGQEILQYFTAFGIGGIGVLILYFVGGSLMNTEFITIGQKEQFDRKDGVYRYYCGKYVGIFYDYFTNVFVYMSFIVMCSGAGAALNQYYGLPSWIGVVVMALVAGFTVTLGLKRIADIIGKIGPALIVITILICIPNIFMGGSIKEGIELIPDLDLIKASDSWIMSAFNYLGFGILWMVAFLPVYGKTLQSAKQAAIGQVLGCAFFAITALIVMLAMWANMADMEGAQIPILTLATNLSGVFGGIFAIIILFGIYSSAVPLLYSPATRFVDEKTVKGKVIIVALALFGAFVALLLPFNELLNLIYVVNGYVGIIFIILVIIKVIVRNVKKTSIEN